MYSDRSLSRRQYISNNNNNNSPQHLLSTFIQPTGVRPGPLSYSQLDGDLVWVEEQPHRYNSLSVQSDLHVFSKTSTSRLPICEAHLFIAACDIWLYCFIHASVPVIIASTEKDILQRVYTVINRRIVFRHCIHKISCKIYERYVFVVILSSEFPFSASWVGCLLVFKPLLDFHSMYFIKWKVNLVALVFLLCHPPASF